MFKPLKLMFAFCLVLGLHTLQLPLYWLAAEYGRAGPPPDTLYVVLGFGVTQLIYVVPLLLVLFRRRQWVMGVGAVSAAVLTLAVNGVLLTLLDWVKSSL